MAALHATATPNAREVASSPEEVEPRGAVAPIARQRARCCVKWGRARSWCLAFALAVAAPAGYARDDEPAPPAQAGAPAAIAASESQAAAIPVNEIAVQAESVESWARDVEAELATSVEERVRAQLAQTESEISRRHASLAQLPVGPSAGRALAAERAGWQDLDGRLAEAQRELERAGDGLERRLAEARARSARWNLTAAEARRANVPASVLAAVQDSLSTLGRESERIEQSRNRLLALEQRERLQRRSVTSAIERVQSLRGELRSRLLERDQPPLWALRPPADVRADLQRLADRFGGVAREIRDYSGRNRDRLLAQLALIAFLMWGAVRVRPTLLRVCGENGRGASVLRHPVAAGLLAGLAPARAFSPDAPPEFLSLVGVVALAPWLRVLSGVLPPSLRGPLCWLAALVFLDFARGTIQTFPLLARLALVAELGLGTAVAAHLRRPEPTASIATLGGRAWQRSLALWLRLAVVALVAGIPAAVLGYAELASLLAAAPVLGSFMGTVLLVAVLVLELLLHGIVDGGALDRVHLIRSRHGALLRGAAGLLRTAAVAAWLYLILDFTTLGDPLWPWMGRVLAAPIGYGSVSLTLGGALAFLLAIWGSWLLARFSALALETEVFPRVRMPPGVPFALATVTRYAVLFAGFVVALGMIGFSLDRVTILVGALGVGVGFGLQNVVNNFVSGVILLFERPIRVGDRIQLEDLVGDVTQIGMRASRVRTLDGIDLIVPNADFISARVANWTLADHARRVSLPVGVAYGTPPRRVIELLDRVARTHPEVLASPEPEVLFRGFGDSSLDFELRVWTDGRLIYRVQSDLAMATHDALEQAGIEIPFPQRDLHLRSVPPGAASALPDGDRDDGDG